MAATLAAAFSATAANVLEQLIADARTGDRAALDRFLTLIQSRVFTFAFRVIGNYAAAEDVTQEALFRICCNLHRYRQGTNLWGWIYSITVRLAHDQRPKVQPEPLAETEGSALEEDQERREKFRHVLAAMSVLSEKERLALILMDIEGFTSKEAAAIMSCLSITARTRAAQARRKLRNELGKRYPELKEQTQ